MEIRATRCQTGHRRSMAPARIPALLAVAFRKRPGRPTIDPTLIQLIKRLSQENPSGEHIPMSPKKVVFVRRAPVLVRCRSS